MVESRAEKLMSNAKELEAIVILNGSSPYLDSTFWYLTEQNSGSFEGSLIVVKQGGSMEVIVSMLEEETARTSKGNISVYTSKKERDDLIKNALKGVSKVGFNTHNVSYFGVEYIKKIVEEIEIVDASVSIDATLSVKDNKEIELIEKACNISSRVAREIPEMLSEGMTEKNMASIIDTRMIELGGTGNAFSTISAFGANSSQPHYSPGDKKLETGDVTLFDFGTKYEAYCSDLTRTLFFGKPVEILERAYNVVLEAQEAGLEFYFDGAKAKDADSAARKVIDDSEFKGKFIHSYGHGIGTEVHQNIHVSEKSDQILKAGNIVSAEPGIYLPGVGGIRIEDTCLITKNGFKRLTDFDRKLTIVNQ